MEIVVNKAPFHCAEGLTIQELLVELGLPPEAILVELNCKFVQRTTYPSTELAEGDTLELIQFVGGG